MRRIRDLGTIPSSTHHLILVRRPTMTPHDLRIGLIGVGRMGANMARRLKDQGFPLTSLFDSHHASAVTLASELQIPAFRTSAEVAQLSTCIVTVVSDDKAMRSIYAEQDGSSLLAHAEDRLFINCPTVSPTMQRDVERLVRTHGGQSLEACMAGSITQAR